MKRIVKGITALTEKGNTSVKFRNVASKDWNRIVGDKMVECGMERISNQSFVMEYIDEDGNILYACADVVFTKTKPSKSEKEVRSELIFEEEK